MDDSSGFIGKKVATNPPPSRGVELPSYKRTTAITPAAAPVGFAEATQGSQAALNTFGALSSQIGMSAAKESATLAGIEAGQAPGSYSGVPITEVDKVFKQSYIEESTKTLASQADFYINNISSIYNKILEPTGKDLSSLLEQRDNVNQLADLADPHTKHELQRLISDKFEGEAFKFSQKVNVADQKRMLSTFKTMSAQNRSNISDFYTNGNPQAGDRAFAAESWNLETAFSKRLITEDELKTGQLEIKSLKEFSIANSERMNSFASRGEAGEADYINAYHNTDHKDMTYLEKKSIVDGLVKAAADDSKARHMSQDLAYSEAHAEIFALDGQLPVQRWREIQSKVSNQQFNNLQEQYMRLNAENVEAKRTFSAISNDKSDVKAMGKYTSKQINSYFRDAANHQQAQIEANGGVYTNPLLHEANIAATIKAPVPDFVENLANVLKYGDAFQAADAAKAITALSFNNPIALKGLDKEARSTAYAFDVTRTNTQAGDDKALETARQSVYNLSPEVLAERELDAKRWMNQSQGNGNTYENSNPALRKKIDNSMGGKRWFGRNTLIPDGMVQQFRELMPAYYLRNGDKDRAWKELVQDMSQVWIETGINNRPEYMRNPPAEVVSEMNNGSYLQNSKAFALHQMIEENKRLNADPNAFVMNKYEWKDDPFVGKNLNEIDWLRADLVKGNPKITVEYEVNGKTYSKERDVVVKADQLTVSPANKVASWSFHTTVANGAVEEPLSDLTQPNGVARWYVSPGLYAEQMGKYTREELEAANRIKLIAENDISVERLDSDAYWILEHAKDYENKNKVNEVEFKNGKILNEQDFNEPE